MQNEFLQSDEWMKFQEAVGRKTFCISGDDFRANIIEHKLPLVGKYFYVPRGPIFHPEGDQPLAGNQISNKIQEIINLAKKESAGWIRIDIENSRILDLIRKNWRVVKAPHDMQPREVFVVDISKSEEELLAEMKSKTRYNIKLAEKRDVFVETPRRGVSTYVDEFIRLTRVMAERNKITAHPENYYRKMLETISPDILKLYVAEYQGKIIATNIMVFYEDTAVYLHGASAAADEYRNVMAPYLLQWQAILDAKKAGCKFYDFGGVNMSRNSWQGITKFKTGFSPKTKPVEFLGSYDIVLNPLKYNLYRIIQKVKSFL